MLPRVFYYAPASTDRLNARHGTSLDVPAVRNKVLGVCSALRTAGWEASVVSSIVPYPISRFFSRPEIDSDGAAPIITVPVIGSYVIKRMTAAFALLLFTIRDVRRGDRVIFYNFFPEYVFSALVLRLKGTPAILDMEDGPIAEDKDLISRVTRVAYPILDKLCARQRLTVSHQLGKRMGYETYMPVYGIADYFDTSEPGGERFLGETLHVLFGGNIMKGTGADLFMEAVELLCRRHSNVPIHIHVTGHYNEERMKALAQSVSGHIRVTLHGLVSAADYRDLTRVSAVGLCLKLPSHSVGQTTFPSKVVEIAATGMLLVTMDVSDVRQIFGSDSAMILRDESAEELVATLVWAENNRAAAAERARLGRCIVRETLSSEAVGKKLGDFLFG